MNSLIVRLTNSPVLARVAPFVVFIVLTSCQGFFGEAGRYWIYLAKTVVGAWMLWIVRPVVQEMRWKVSWEAVVIGVSVFILWVGLDDWLIRLGFANSYPKMKLSGPAWNPGAQFGEATPLAWFFIFVRISGLALVVPPLEEVFFRSFLYRYVIKADFLSVPLGAFAWVPFLAVSLLFGFEHREWLAGVLCGFAYQGLVCQKKRLGDAITAHAITNFLLGLWVVGKGAWHFW
jgi:hypothetical protein